MKARDFPCTQKPITKTDQRRRTNRKAEEVHDENRAGSTIWIHLRAVVSTISHRKQEPKKGTFKGPLRDLTIKFHKPHFWGSFVTGVSSLRKRSWLDVSTQSNHCQVEIGSKSESASSKSELCIGWFYIYYIYMCVCVFVRMCTYSKYTHTHVYNTDPPLTQITKPDSCKLVLIHPMN